ncbi:hypothetical protein PENTCL1PPCAC_79, partial [Pristionchus entomophagus]
KHPLTRHRHGLTQYRITGRQVQVAGCYCPDAGLHLILLFATRPIALRVPPTARRLDHRRRLQEDQDGECLVRLFRVRHRPRIGHAPDARQLQATPSDHVHAGAAGAARRGIPEKSLPGHLRSRGFGEENEPERSQNSGVVPKPARQAPQAGEADTEVAAARGLPVAESGRNPARHVPPDDPDAERLLVSVSSSHDVRNAALLHRNLLQSQSGKSHLQLHLGERALPADDLPNRLPVLGFCPDPRLEPLTAISQVPVLTSSHNYL